MNYKKEREHDVRLIDLVKDLAKANRLDVLEQAFRIEALGQLEQARHRRPFDVELTFANLTVAVESKVDSDEGERWSAHGQPHCNWQTHRIARQARDLTPKTKMEFRFITYGTSEFYTKVVAEDPLTSAPQGSDGLIAARSGPASERFQHIKLDDMIGFVDKALEAMHDHNGKYGKWLAEMKKESAKRSMAPALLESFQSFRRHYLKVHGDIDFPRNRLLCSLPELAFPMFHALAEELQRCGVVEEFGFDHVCVYPMGRLTPAVHDSILSFGTSGLGTHFTEAGFYFEINEDFNLNVKSEDTKLDKDNPVWSSLEQAPWPPSARVRRRGYVQQVLVLFEIDFGFLDNIRNIPEAAKKLRDVLGVAVGALSQ